MNEDRTVDHRNVQLVRLQKTSRLFVLILSACLLLLIPLLLFVIRNPLGAFVCGVGFFVTVFSLFLIGKGKSRLGTGITLIVLISLVIPVGMKYTAEPEVLPSLLITIISLAYMVILPAGILVNKTFMLIISVYFGGGLAAIILRSGNPVLIGRMPVILASYGFVCLLGWALSRLQNSLLEDTSKAAGESEAGALKMRSVIGNIGGLKKSIDTALHTTKESLGRINAIIGTYIDRVNELSASSASFGSELKETNADLERLKDLLDRSTAAGSAQAALVETGVSRNGEMLEATARISESILKANDFNRDLLDRTSRGVKDLESSLRTIHGLHEYQTRIKDIVKVISDVSERTSLLSINASIEAAHSGATGKGFKVVADEIKKLAEQSATHTKDISEVVSSMVGAIDTAITSAEKVEGTLIDIVRELEEYGALMVSVVESGDSLREKNNLIYGNFTEISRHTDIVESSTKEHGQVFGAFETTVKRLSDYFSGMAALATSLRGSNEEAKKLLGELREVSAGNDRLSAEIDSLLDSVSS